MINEVTNDTNTALFANTSHFHPQLRPPSTMPPTSYDGSNCTPGLSSDDPPDLLASLISTSLELAYVLEDLRQLGGAIDSPGFGTKRAELHRRLNELQSLTRTLPPEILITIFHYASPLVDFTPSKTQFVSKGQSNMPESHVQITLSQVCSYWRRIIQSTPEFWSTAVIKVKQTSLSVQRKNSLLQLYLDNVSSMLISLQLELSIVNSPNHSMLGYDELLPIIDSISGRAQKFKLLNLISPLATWVPRISSKFINLEHFLIQDVIDGDDLEMIFGALPIQPPTTIPNLRQMYFCQSQANHLPIITWKPNVHCHTVTVLCMDNLPLKTCVHFLTACPNLTEYRCRLSSSVIDGDIKIPHLNFPHMRIFHAPCSLYNIVSSHLHFPRLETLGLGLGLGRKDRILDPIFTFLRRLPTTWSILTLTFLNMPEESTSSSNSTIFMRRVKKIFGCIPHHVQSLHLLEISHTALAIVLEALGNTTTQVFIPGLRHIYLDTTYLPAVYSVDPDDLNDYEGTRRRRLSILNNPKLLMKMLWARKEQLIGDSFWLEMSSKDGFYWCHVERSLCQLTSTGIPVRLTQGGKTVEPMRGMYGDLCNPRCSR